MLIPTCISVDCPNISLHILCNIKRIFSNKPTLKKKHREQIDEILLVHMLPFSIHTRQRSSLNLHMNKLCQIILLHNNCGVSRR